MLTPHSLKQLHLRNRRRYGQLALRVVAPVVEIVVTSRYKMKQRFNKSRRLYWFTHSYA